MFPQTDSPRTSRRQRLKVADLTRGRRESE